jgi:hypothetical protein
MLFGTSVHVLLQSSAAQTTHVVGNAMGWVVPSNSATTYTLWASNKTFAVGDILQFLKQEKRHVPCQCCEF